MRRITLFAVIALFLSTSAWAQTAPPASPRIAVPAPAPVAIAVPTPAHIAIVAPAPMPAVAAIAPQTTPPAAPVRPATVPPATPQAPTMRPASGVVAPQAPTTPPPARATTSTPSSWQNVKLEFTITDTFGSKPTNKTVSMLVVDRGTGRIRSSMQIRQPQQLGGFTTIVINIDATVTLPSARGIDLAARGLAPATFGATGQILLNLTVQYVPDVSVQPEAGGVKPASLDESLNLVVWDGKPTLVSQSADPQGDRKVTLEVTATVVK